MSDANAGTGPGEGPEQAPEHWFGQGGSEGQPAATPSPDAQPTQYMPQVPAEPAAPTQPIPQQYGQQQPPQPAPPASYGQQPQQSQPPLYGQQQPQYGQEQQPQQYQEQQYQQQAPSSPYDQSPYGQAPYDQAAQTEQQQPASSPYGQPAQPEQSPWPAQFSAAPAPTQQPFGAGSGLPADDSGSWDEPKPRRNRVALATGIGVAAVIGLATVLVVTQTGGTANAAKTTAAAASTKPKPKPSGFQPTATTAAGKAEQMAQTFLAAWQSGNFSQAASYTDDPADAQNVLSSYRTGLNLSGLQLTAQAATAAGLVNFSINASISSTGVISADGGSVTPTTSTSSSAPATSTGTGTAAATTPAPTATSASGNWSYTSHLTAYEKNGGWYVKWDPTMVAPNVTNSVHPVALAVAPGAGEVTDASGNNLSSSSQQSLVNIAALLKKNTKSSQGTAGLEIALEDSSGKIVSGSANALSNPVSTAVVKTTIDPTLEQLAIAGVAQHPKSAMVVLRPSTGAILAVANSPGIGDTALVGTLAPGSSMKVVTTTGLMVDGMLPQGINTQVGCPLVEDVQGVKIHNSTSSANSSAGTEDFEPPTTPFSTDFAQSCNNAFTQWWQQMAGGKLANAASTYYGLNQQWDLGLGSKGTYFEMPSDQSGSELAEELYGQGLVEANPLSMASIAATVDTGAFHQPYFVDGVTDKATGTPLPSAVQSSLYTVMREVITSGTAAGVGFGSGVYGKTGTAEADANKDHNPNGWMIVFDPSKDLAIASVVIDAGFGASTAGPEVNYVLQHS